MPYGSSESGRIPNSAHEAGPWRIRELVPDFRLEDTWALPAQGGPDDFPRMLEVLFSLDPAASDSRAAGLLWKLRDLLGAWLGLGRVAAGPEDDDLSTPAARRPHWPADSRRICAAPQPGSTSAPSPSSRST